MVRVWRAHCRDSVVAADIDAAADADDDDRHDTHKIAAVFFFFEKKKPIFAIVFSFFSSFL